MNKKTEEKKEDIHNHCDFCDCDMGEIIPHIVEEKNSTLFLCEFCYVGLTLPEEK